MPVIGITGGLGTGKTIASKFFESLGYIRIDVDEISHDLIRRGKKSYRDIVKHFGKYILKENKEIDRRKLAYIIFNNKKEKDYLEKLLHPLIKKEILVSVKKALNKKPCVIVDFPILFEMKMERFFDFIVCVVSDKAKQIERAKRKGIDKTLAEKIISSQISISKKKKKSNFVLRNNSNVEDLKQQVISLCKIISQWRI